MAGKAGVRPQAAGRKGSSKQAANGHLPNGRHVNGQINGNANGNIAKPTIPKTIRSSKSGVSRRGFLRSITSILARIFIWYTIITTAFRCPPSSIQLTDASPKICKPYLHTKQTVAPYLDPYYDTYIKPYVEEVRPYAEKVKHGIIAPASSFATNNYNAYVAPRVADAQEFAGQQWEKKVAPQLITAQARAKSQYSASLGPHVDKAWVAAYPYYQSAQSSASDFYSSKLLPAYFVAVPYGQQAYDRGYHYTVNIGYPYAQSAWGSTSAFLGRTIWPQIRILYGENVEPQLVRISERLRGYRDGKRIMAAVESVKPTEEDSSTMSEASSVVSSASSSEASDSTSETKSTNSGKPVLSDEEVAQKIKEDLTTWQEKFAKAADKGTEDLEQRVREVTSRQISSQAKGVGNALLLQFEKTIDSKLSGLQKLINDNINEMSEEADEEETEKVLSKVNDAVRDAGVDIRSSAQAIRNFRVKYDEETLRLVKAASESTLEVLDNIRDLGLSEIGMRWAWMEGVSYKDWSKYHTLRKTFDKWRDEVEEVALDHDGLHKAKEEGEHIEDKGMEMAQDAAKKLLQHKADAEKKINGKVSLRGKAAQRVKEAAEKATEIASSVFLDSSKGILESASSAVTRRASDASSAVLGTSTGTVESAFSAAGKEISEAVIGSEPPAHESAASAASSVTSSASSIISETASSVASQARSNVASAASGASKKVWGGAEAQFVAEAKEPVYEVEFDESGESVVDKIQNAATDAENWLARIVSDAIGRPTATQGAVESMTSMASEQYERALAAASSAIYGSEKGSVESLTSLANEKYSQAVTAASLAIYGTPNPAYVSIMSQASASYASLTDELKADFTAKRAQIVTPGRQPGHAAKQALVMAHNALQKELTSASASLSRALQATSALSQYLPRATPAPGSWESVTSAASVRLQQGLSQASAQYSSAKVAVGMQPTPAHQAYLADAQRKYFEAVGFAYDRYGSFVSAASTAVYGTPTPAYESLLSAASTAVYGTPTPAYESLISAAQNQYREASASASVALEQMLASASSLAGVTSKSPAESLLSSMSSSYSAAVSAAQGSYDSAASQARGNLDLLMSKASEQIYGSPTPYAQSLYSQAGTYGAQATDAAAEQYAALSALVSELMYGKEPDFTESVMNRFSSAYHTGIAAYASAASSYAADAYASASSVVGSVFTPPPALEAILDSASSQLDSAVSAASVQIYGSEKGTIEKATSAAASAYDAAHSKASAAVYGTQPSYAEAAQGSLAEIAAQAQKAVSEAIYGTQRGTLEAATSGAASAYSSMASAAAENYSAASAAVSEAMTAAAAKASEAVYGPEQGTLESASSRLAAAVESARAKLSEYGAAGSSSVADNIEAAQGKIEEMASSISSAASSVTGRVKDEL